MNQWFREGLSGRSVQATFRLYVVSLSVLCGLGAVAALLGGSRLAFQLIPWLSGGLVVLIFWAEHRAERATSEPAAIKGFSRTALKLLASHVAVLHQRVKSTPGGAEWLVGSLALVLVGLCLWGFGPPRHFWVAILRPPPHRIPTEILQTAAGALLLAVVLRQLLRVTEDTPITSVRERATGRFLYAQYGTTLTGATLVGRDLQRAALAGRDLAVADLGQAHLVGADLTGARLTGANLRKANLAEAVLTGAHLTDADLSGATVTSASVAGANLQGANLAGVDLRFIAGGPGALRMVNLRGARYDTTTRWPRGFDPVKAECIDYAPELEEHCPPLRMRA